MALRVIRLLGTRWVSLRSRPPTPNVITSSLQNMPWTSSQVLDGGVVATCLALCDGLRARRLVAVAPVDREMIVQPAKKTWPRCSLPLCLPASL